MNDSLRSALMAQRSKLTSHDVQDASQVIISQLMGLDIYQNAEHVLFYHAVGAEVNLHDLYQQALADKKACYFPVITDYQQKQMRFMRCDQGTIWQSNCYDIPEPSSALAAWLPDDVPCLLLAPLVGFRTDCHRLGMGAGFYDRWIAQRVPRPTCLGVAYDFQHSDGIEPADWDEPLHGIVSPSQLYWSSILPAVGRVD